MKVDHKTLLDEQNAVAHLDSLKAELAEVTAALSETTKEHSFLLQENERVSSASAELLSQTTKQVEELKYQIDVGHRKAREVTEYLGKHSASTLDIAAMEQEAQIALHQQKSTMAENDITIDRQIKFIKELEEHVGTLSNEKENHLKKMEELISHTNNLSDKHNSSRQQNRVELDELDKGIISKQIELDSLNSNIEEARKKVSIPLERLKEEEAKLTLLRRDVGIYEARIIEKYQKVFPDRKINL